MNNKIQLLISIILLLIFISTIAYNTNFRRDEIGEILYKEVNSFILKDSNNKNSDVYNTFLKSFDCKGDKYYYSFIELDGYDYPILLLTNGVYKFKNERDVTIWTDVYYPVNNQITRFGGIGSDGTAYPISADKSGIFTSGGHNVAKYGLDVKSGKLKLIYKYIMFFDVVGEEVRSITVGIIDNENKIVGENELNKANAEYGSANRIYFKRLC